MSKKTRQVKAGNVLIGGGAPVSVQSMTNTDTADVEATLSAGCDIRHGLIGAGVYASHGYERSHIDGVYNTLCVLKGYLGI